MAKKEENEKGFLVIKTESLSEALMLAGPGGRAVCDCCNKSSFVGYYIAVLNDWYCERCYEEWLYLAKRYVEDIEIEVRNYAKYSNLLNLSLPINVSL